MKTSKKIPLCCAALLSASMVSALLAANEALPNQPTPSPEINQRADAAGISRPDRTFLERAAKSGLKEIDISKAVESRVTDPQVKALAQMMITEHTAVNTEVLALATSRGVTIPAENVKVTEKWSKKSKDLDDEYLSEMQSDHEDAVDLFEKALKSDDAEIAAFARKTLPSLQHHLSTVKQIRKNL